MSNSIVAFPKRVWGKLRRMKKIHTLRKQVKAYFEANPNTVFLVLTPSHGNLGDHAIALAETNLLKKAGVNYIEITGNKLNDMRWNGMLEVMDGFPILLQGGGYLGTLWHSVEDDMRKLIEKTPRSHIIVFPNTIYYEDSDWGKEEFEKSKKIYSRHKHLHLYAREKNSYEIMKNAYRDVTLTPDMVLSLNECKDEQERRGCLLCLRSDHERTRTEEQECMIRQQAAKMFGDAVSDTDMVVNRGIPIDRREEELREKFDQFSHAELVITDRLHGMIFCAITGTPCIVVDSKSPKVRGCCEWIKNLDYIRFVDDVSNISDAYADIPQGKHVYDNTHLQHYYDELIEVVKSYAHN